MNRSLTASLLLCAAFLSSCALPPKNHSQVLHGDRRGGDVPLYMMGSLPDFSNAGLVLGRYVRTEYDIFDLDSNGFLSPSWDHDASPLAQVAIPRLVASIDIPGHFEVRYALPADDTSDPTGQSIAFNDRPVTPSASAPHAAPDLASPAPPSFGGLLRGNSFFQTVTAARSYF